MIALILVIKQEAVVINDSFPFVNTEKQEAVVSNGSFPFVNTVEQKQEAVVSNNSIPIQISSLCMQGSSDLLTENFYGQQPNMTLEGLLDGTPCNKTAA
jgi:hypothetical protein